jgi:hypothetical protein
VVELNYLWSQGVQCWYILSNMLVLEYYSFTTCPLLIAFCLFTETFIRLVLLVLPVYVHRSLAYKYSLGVLLQFIKCLIV